MDPPESEDLYCVSKSVLIFTNDLCRTFARSIKMNYVCSTFSTHMALSMLAYGADDNTDVQMSKFLRLHYNDFELLRDYRRIINILNTDDNIVQNDQESDEETLEISGGEGTSVEKQDNHNGRRPMSLEDYSLTKNKKTACVATLANKIFISNNRVKLRELYKNALSMCFQSKSQILDCFDRTESADIINKWCIEATDGKISDVIDSDNLSDAIGALILVSAVHFRGTWLHQFATARPKTFHLNLFKKIEVPTMYLKKYLPYRYLKEINAHAVRLDFLRSQKYMEIIVPNRTNGLRVIRKLLYKISVREFKYTKVRLWLPKFEIQSLIKLEDHLKKSKMKDAFDKSRANFKKICDQELYLKTIVQKAHIKVDELGCEATEALKVPLDGEEPATYSRKKQRIVTLKANKPFLFRIMDTRLNIPLFIGMVVDPTSQLSVNN